MLFLKVCISRFFKLLKQCYDNKIGMILYIKKVMLICAPQFRLESLQTNPASVELQIVFVVGQSDENEVYYPPDESQEHTDEGDIVENRLVFSTVHTSGALVVFSHLPLPHQDAKSVAASQEDRDRHNCQ